MIIRKTQFRRYLQQDEDDFVGLIIKHLREEDPDLVAHLSDDTFREMVTAGLARARSHGLNTDEDLMAFVSVMFEVAPNFDEHPVLHGVLTNERLPIDKRFDALFAPHLDQAWQEAEDAYDTNAWLPELVR